MTNINFESLTGRTETHLATFQSSLVHQDVIRDLSNIEEQLASNGIQFAIASGFRSYERQVEIWNEKAEGKRDLRDKEGNVLEYSILSEEEILEAILNWSAIPGASRHHWGTDLDVFDARFFSDENPLRLLCEEYENTDSPCYDLHVYFSENKTPFFRPYTKDSEGIQREPWHISHKEISKQFLDNYDLNLFKKNLEASKFSFCKKIKKNPDFYFKKIFLI